MNAQSLNTPLTWGVMAALFVLVLRYGRVFGVRKGRGQSAEDADEKLVKDPVCGMEIDPVHAAGNSIYRGRTYHFCSTACREQFDQDPIRFAYEPPRKRGCC